MSTKRFDPKPYIRHPITIRLKEDKLEYLDRLAFRCDISRNELINQCLDYALENMPQFPSPENRENNSNHDSKEL